MEAAGYDAHDQFAVKLAVEEAVVTALKRNGFDPDLRVRVRVRFTVTQDRLDVRVSAEGSR